MSVLRGDFATDAGMLCIWSPTAFGKVIDYDSWDKELAADRAIRKHIKAGDFVPVNIGGDGCFAVELRVGSAAKPEGLTDRESQYAVVASEPYLLTCDGSLCVSGIEHVHRQPGESVGVLRIAEGRYEVTVHLIGWDDEPGMKDKRGKPKRGALPDFVVLVNPEQGRGHKYRTEVETFPPPPQ